MHLVISGPYEVHYTTAVDIWSFSCLLLNIVIGKCGPLLQRGVGINSGPKEPSVFTDLITPY